jgi:hypothetical protein
MEGRPMSITQVVQWLYQNLEYPWVLAFIIPLVPLTIYVLRKDFLKLKEEPEVKAVKRKTQFFMMFTRTLIFLALLIAIASPFTQKEKTIEGDTFIQLLVDNSTSMELFKNNADELKTKLEKKLNTEVKVIGLGETSNIGDEILNTLQPHGSVLLFSDGNANAGAALGDVALYASKIDATINAISLEPQKKEANVVILGPSKTMEDAENTFTVLVRKVGDVGPVKLTVTLDGETVYDQVTADPAIQINRKLPQGTHQFTAKIDFPDHFAQNNV